MFGDAALERLSYTLLVTSLTDGSTVEDVGKGLHVYRRQSDGVWKIDQDIWNSDRMQVLPLRDE